MAADPEAMRRVAVLEDALRHSGWYDRASLQDSLYAWAATGLP